MRDYIPALNKRFTFFCRLERDNPFLWDTNKKIIMKPKNNVIYNKNNLLLSEKEIAHSFRF
jgi:hypothetical protein